MSDVPATAGKRWTPGFPGAHVPLAAHAQLPPVVLRPDHLAERLVDAVGGPVLAGLQAHPQRLRSGHHGGTAVRAGPAVRDPRRPDGRPLRQAQGAARHPNRLHGTGRGALGARRQRLRAPVDGLGAGPGLWLHQRRRQPVPPELRRRDGRPRRPGQRGRLEQRHRQLVTYRRAGSRRPSDRHRGPVVGLPGQRGLLCGRDRRTVRDADLGAAPQASRGSRQGADPGRAALRLAGMGAARAADHDGRHRHAGLQLHRDPAALCPRRVPSRRRYLQRLAGRPGRRRPCRRAGHSLAAAAEPSAAGGRHARLRCAHPRRCGGADPARSAWRCWC